MVARSDIDQAIAYCRAWFDYIHRATRSPRQNKILYDDNHNRFYGIVFSDQFSKSFGSHNGYIAALDSYSECAKLATLSLICESNSSSSGASYIFARGSSFEIHSTLLILALMALRIDASGH